MLIFSLANVLHQSLEPEDTAKVLLLHFCTILRSLLTDYLLFFCDHCPTVLPRWVQPGTLQCYISLRVFQREGPNTNDIDHHLVGRLTKFNLLPGARGCRGPRSNRIGEGSSWIIILSQRELCWTIMMILKYSEYDHIFHMNEGENEDNGDKACTCAVFFLSHNPSPRCELANIETCQYLEQVLFSHFGVQVGHYTLGNVYAVLMQFNKSIASFDYALRLMKINNKE